MIAENIKNVAEAYNMVPIIYTKTYSPDSELVRTMIDHDLKLYITYDSASAMKDQLEKAMTDYYEPEANQREEYIRALELKKEEALIYQRFKTIAVAGTLPRIGTTTQAMQIAKYLNLKGHKAAVVELNSVKYPDTEKGKYRELSFVEKIRAWFGAEKEDPGIGMLNCFNLDMFYKQENLSEIMRRGFDEFCCGTGYCGRTNIPWNSLFSRKCKTQFLVFIVDFKCFVWVGSWSRTMVFGHFPYGNVVVLYL